LELLNHPHRADSPVQPRLVGLDVSPRAVPATVRPAAAPTLVHDRKRVRRRYWSMRDLSRRLWYGRGYDLLRELIHGGVLPAARSARSWWVDDSDVAGLLAAFDARAGKVRAFRGLDAWLRERCHVAPLTPEVEALIAATGSGFAWRGAAYLPKDAWHATGSGEQPAYFHRSGVTISAAAPLAA
jgi:hypothetical protein